MNCTVEGCLRPVKVMVRRLCNAHYVQLQRSGPLPPVDRFALMVEKTDTCWLWRGRREKGGYGRWGGQMAHRVAWERAHGTIPAGLTIDHRCRNRACVRPGHLRPVPPSANFSDNGWRDQTHCRRGHEWSEANTRVRVRAGRTHRVCRACDRERQAECKARRRP